MKRVLWAVLGLLVLAAPVAAEEAERTVGFGFDIAFAGHFIDGEQFEDDLDRAGLRDFPALPFGMGWSFYIDLLRNNHVFRFGGRFCGLTIEDHRNGRYVNFEDRAGGLLLGYQYLLGDHFGWLVNAVVGQGMWTYDLHSPDWHGRVDYSYLWVEPEIGCELKFGVLGLGLAGAYHTETVSTGALYSGDMTRDGYRDLDQSRFVVRMYLTVGGAKRPRRAAVEAIEDATR